MKTRLAAAALLVALTAPATASPAAAQVRPSVSPGMWDIATTLDNVQVQGAMAGMGAMLRGKTMRMQHCITPEEAARGPAEAANARKNCTYAKQSVSGGHLSVEAVCHHGPTTEQIAEDGEYSPGGFHMKARAVQTGGSMPMTMDMTIVGTRTGDCK